ncbi:pyocin knob domain-containing protein [Flammeovirga sp. SJP92]|uniref:pyocin knob domain-containing protein n=1 Tax=Flammeovirga sp. SJP92 TaxID=1775430 RepID=UPI0007874661|nr:pyocin knob domain-containing protein [Flammeovirga sp. SJP92]KXX71237.1 hypothetical protein AVL50_09275 [Flammeovirga sp. SJP92]
MKKLILTSIISIYSFVIFGQETIKGDLTVEGRIIGGFGAEHVNGVLDWNDKSNTKSGNGLTLLRGDAPNGPKKSNYYFHPFNFEYISKNGTGNITQFAIPYGASNAINEGMYMRGRYSNNWTDWVKVLSENTSGQVRISTGLGIGSSSVTAPIDVATTQEYQAHNANKLIVRAPNSSGTDDQRMVGLSLSLDYSDNMHKESQKSVGIFAQSTSSWSNRVDMLFYTRNYEGEKSYDERMRISGSGDVGIGISKPSAKLDVDGIIKTNESIQIKTNQFASNVKPNITLSSTIALGKIEGIDFRTNESATFRGGLSFKTRYHTDGDDNGFHERMIIDHYGNVGIGTNETTDFRLSVKGKIRAEEVKVYTGWADYVFEEDYNLKSLSEVEAHIKEHKHLPDVPSAKEVEENGVNVGETEAMLLRKIEELTLYTIEQQKQIEYQSKQIRNLEKEKERNDALEERLSKIESLLNK